MGIDYSTILAYGYAFDIKSLPETLKNFIFSMKSNQRDIYYYGDDEPYESNTLRSKIYRLYQRYCSKEDLGRDYFDYDFREIPMLGFDLTYTKDSDFSKPKFNIYYDCHNYTLYVFSNCVHCSLRSSAHNSLPDDLNAMKDDSVLEQFRKDFDLPEPRFFMSQYTDC
jgi:hypothetical protein